MSSLHDLLNKNVNFCINLLTMINQLKALALSDALLYVYPRTSMYPAGL